MPRKRVILRLQLFPYESFLMSSWVYIMTNQRNGTLYVGVTTHLARRVKEHQEGLIEGFTKRYSLKTLVYAEEYATLAEAVWREKAIKAWRRDWKILLIETHNPGWEDLTGMLI